MSNGTFCQYWHSIEPCNPVYYLYKYSDKPNKTDTFIKCVVCNFYKTKPNGLK